MKTKFTQKNHLFSIENISVLSILVVLLATVNPMEWNIFRSASAYSVGILFGIAATGFIALAIRKDKIILTSFASCILLCAHMKEAQHSTFAYATTNQETPQLSVASFSLETPAAINLLNLNILDTKADLITIQVPAQSIQGEWLKAQTNKKFPYYQKTICGDSLAMIILSKAQIKELDTLCFDNAISIAGVIHPEGFVDDVAFISTHLPNSQLHTEQQLSLLSSYIDEHYANKPFLTLSGTSVETWMPEMRHFKTAHSLYDSRTDISFTSPDKHIFYSSSLECTSFKNVLDEKGILATYKLKAAGSNSTDKVNTAAL